MLRGLAHLIVWTVLAAGCQATPDPAPAPTSASSTDVMDRVAEAYVKLALALARYDPPYVDAYYGPEEWKTEVQTTKPSREEIKADATTILADLDAAPPDGEDEIAERRHRYLRRQVASLVTRMEILGGTKLTFDEESQALYDAVAPPRSPEDFQVVLDELDRLLPGDGSLVARFEAFKTRFVIPDDKLDTVFRTAIEACRDRTRKYVDLPDGESFDVEYVTDMPWAAYNWYKGNFHSLIQVNTGQPIFIDRAIDLACHEGYPGHHVYNVLIEQHLVRDRKWVEFSLYALFSPQSLISEGTANFGIEVAFPGEERLTYEREVLFPLAGLDPTEVGRYYEIHALIDRLGYANVEGARRFVDGELDVLGVYNWLRTYALMPRPRPALEFMKEYRSYVINYVLGRDLVKAYAEARGGTPEDAESRWREFHRLLTIPIAPSELAPS